jgi:hypothetical protein
MITILGAGGVIANEVVKLLSSARKQPFRLVARPARPVPGTTEMISADLSHKDQTIRAVAGFLGELSAIRKLADVRGDCNTSDILLPLHRVSINYIKAPRSDGSGPTN